MRTAFMLNVDDVLMTGGWFVRREHWCVMKYY